MRVLREAKLVDGIKLDNGREKNAGKVFIEFDNTNACELHKNKNSQIQAKVTTIASLSIATRNFDIFDKFCIPYIKSKLTCVVRRNK